MIHPPGYEKPSSKRKAGGLVPAALMEEVAVQRVHDRPQSSFIKHGRPGDTSSHSDTLDGGHGWWHTGFEIISRLTHDHARNTANGSLIAKLMSLYACIVALGRDVGSSAELKELHDFALTLWQKELEEKSKVQSKKKHHGAGNKGISCSATQHRRRRS